MITEYQVKRRAAAIRASTLTPSRKARLFLQMGRTLREQAERFSVARKRSKVVDPMTDAHLGRMERRNTELREELRSEALGQMMRVRFGKR
jgi:hypothetical protein